MRFSALFLICCVFSVQAFPSEYYRWVDENGTVHFSDSPPEFNLEIKVDVGFTATSFESSDIKAPPSPPSPSAPPLVTLSEDIVTEEVLEIASSIALISPPNEATIRNNQGNIIVKASTDFPLGENQSIRVLLDGKKQTNQQRNTVTLENIDRGSHTLSVQLIDNGKVISASRRITVFLHRAIFRKKTPEDTPTPLLN